MNPPAPRDTAPSPVSVTQHVELLRQEIEELLDSKFRAYGSANLNAAEVARLDSEIERLNAIIARYRTLGLLG
ncbi:hypothetical protein [Neorhizobium sp. P12A]|uniref:hypothetical protein n=1 Tax=Neorhizobium sp. P12A TaxID=2268027 RepID=UPI0011EBD62E|nr:hypothetical protein [Neorhizobium sp. P12A]